MVVCASKVREKGERRRGGGRERRKAKRVRVKEIEGRGDRGLHNATAANGAVALLELLTR